MVELSQLAMSDSAVMSPFLAMEFLGVHETAYTFIMKCDINIREDPFTNDAKSSETTTYSGITNLMNKVITSLAPLTQKIKIIIPTKQEYTIWSDGSILSFLATF